MLTANASVSASKAGQRPQSECDGTPHWLATSPTKVMTGQITSGGLVDQKSGGQWVTDGRRADLAAYHPVLPPTGVRAAAWDLLGIRVGILVRT